MGEYADIKRKKVEQMLRWLDTCSEFSVTNGGNHQIIVRHESWNRPFPVPFKHTIIKKTSSCRFSKANSCDGCLYKRRA